MDGTKEDIEKEIEEKNKQLLKEININEEAMGYNTNRQKKYTDKDREKDRQEVQIKNLEGD